MIKRHALLLAFSFLFSFFALSFAQLGEQAGQPTLNVSLGGSATFNYTILNAGDSPISYVVIPPTLNTIPHNVTPTVKITPMNGTLAPHSQQVISIKVYMPSSDKIGLTWQGIVQVVEVAPSATISGGGASATVTAGVAKILTIHSVAPVGWPLWLVIGIAVMIVAIAGGSGYYFFVYRKKAAEKAALEERRAKAKRAVVAMKKPKAVARKAARKPAKKGAKKKAARKASATRARASRRRAK